MYEHKNEFLLPMELAPEEETPNRRGLNQTPADDRFS